MAKLALTIDFGYETCNASREVVGIEQGLSDFFKKFKVFRHRAHARGIYGLIRTLREVEEWLRDNVTEAMTFHIWTSFEIMGNSTLRTLPELSDTDSEYIAPAIAGIQNQLSHPVFVNVYHAPIYQVQIQWRERRHQRAVQERHQTLPTTGSFVQTLRPRGEL